MHCHSVQSQRQLTNQGSWSMRQACIKIAFLRTTFLEITWKAWTRNPNQLSISKTFFRTMFLEITRNKQISFTGPYRGFIWPPLSDPTSGPPPHPPGGPLPFGAPIEWAHGHTAPLSPLLNRHTKAWPTSAGGSYQRRGVFITHWNQRTRPYIFQNVVPINASWLALMYQVQNQTKTCPRPFFRTSYQKMQMRSWLIFRRSKSFNLSIIWFPQVVFQVTAFLSTTFQEMFKTT
jgi:hypothetical protein